MTAKDRSDLHEANKAAAAALNEAGNTARVAASDTRDGEHVRALDGIDAARQELNDAERALYRASSAKERAAAGPVIHRRSAYNGNLLAEFELTDEAAERIAQDHSRLTGPQVRAFLEGGHPILAGASVYRDAEHEPEWAAE